MHEALFAYIRSRSTTPLSESDLDVIRRIFVPKKFRKRQYFLQAGEVCNYGGFIVKGAMRQYSLDDKGTEHIIQLLLDNWWVGDRESFSTGLPSSYYIDAWEESDVLILTRSNFDTMQAIPAIAQMDDVIKDRHFAALERRVRDTISLSAEERYENLVQRYPEFLQRFPQHLIASYLGITKETLSRVRQKALKK